MTLEIMFATARYQPWRGPIGLVLSADRDATVTAETWRRFTPSHDLRVLDGRHNDVFGASAQVTSSILAEFIHLADQQASIDGKAVTGRDVEPKRKTG